MGVVFPLHVGSQLSQAHSCSILGNRAGKAKLEMRHLVFPVLLLFAY